MYNAASLIKKCLLAELANDHLAGYLIHIGKSLILDLENVCEKPQMKLYELKQYPQIKPFVQNKPKNFFFSLHHV